MRGYTYNRGPCRFCGKDISSNGAATAAHNRAHVKDGTVAELSEWTRSGMRIPGTSRFVAVVLAEKHAREYARQRLFPSFKACRAHNDKPFYSYERCTGEQVEFRRRGMVITVHIDGEQVRERATFAGEFIPDINQWAMNYAREYQRTDVPIDEGNETRVLEEQQRADARVVAEADQRAIDLADYNGEAFEAHRKRVLEGPDAPGLL